MELNLRVTSDSPNNGGARVSNGTDRWAGLLGTLFPSLVTITTYSPASAEVTEGRFSSAAVWPLSSVSPCFQTYEIGEPDWATTLNEAGSPGCTVASCGCSVMIGPVETSLTTTVAALLVTFPTVLVTRTE